MWSRALLVLLAMFWLLMNVLLWRSEFGSGAEGGSPVSEELVWGKLLTAPDPSSLELFLDGRKVGYCRWIPNVVADPVAAADLDPETGPEGMVREAHGYTVDLEGNLMLGEPAFRLRFTSRLTLGRDRSWREFNLRLILRPTLVEMHVVAGRPEIEVKFEDGETRWQRTWTWAELARPEALTGEWGAPAGLALVAPLLAGLPGAETAGLTNLTLGLQWEARTDWLRIAHERVRAYRLEARLLDRYRAALIISRVGELMRVELPHGIQLVNETLTNL